MLLANLIVLNLIDLNFLRSNISLVSGSTLAPQKGRVQVSIFISLFFSQSRHGYNGLQGCFIRNILKEDSRLGWPNNFYFLRVILSLKKKAIQFSPSFNLYFQQKRASELSMCHLPTKRSVWVFDVTNRASGFSNFQSYHELVVYLFNLLARSCTLFWKYS